MEERTALHLCACARVYVSVCVCVCAHECAIDLACSPVVVGDSSDRSTFFQLVLHHLQGKGTTHLPHVMHVTHTHISLSHPPPTPPTHSSTYLAHKVLIP